MDESKIIWADQHQENKEDAPSVPEEPVLDVNRLTILPITSSVFISPATMVDQKMFRLVLALLHDHKTYQQIRY